MIEEEIPADREMGDMDHSRHDKCLQVIGFAEHAEPQSRSYRLIQTQAD